MANAVRVWTGVAWQDLALTGPPGADGTDGADGAPGAPGATGAPGPQGAQGATGSQGPAGAQGVQGPAGVDGTDGAPGPQGDAGATGPTGPAGADGATGPPGPEGLNALGPWSPAVAYQVDDLVTRDGSSWLAALPSTGVDPGADQSTNPVGSLTAPSPLALGSPQTVATTITVDRPTTVVALNMAAAWNGPPGGQVGIATAINVPGLGTQWEGSGPIGADKRVVLDTQATLFPGTEYWLVMQAMPTSNIQIDQGPELVGDHMAWGGDFWYGASEPSNNFNGVYGLPVVLYGAAGDDPWLLFSSRGLEGDPGPQGPAGATGPQGPAGTGINMLGQVPTVGDLPPTGNADGDAYTVEADGDLYVWDGDSWNNVGPMQGPQGVPGPQGVQGPTGPAGAQGPQGVQGAAGPTGATGATGSQGPQGLKGDPGAAGPAGATGSQGPQGLKGDPGATGATGATGAQGEPGTPGATGATGAQGPQGLKGDTGATGAQGAQGPAGTAGAQGPAGPGVPTGGAAAQVLTKTSATDFATAWQTPTVYLSQAAADLRYEPIDTMYTKAESDGRYALASALTAALARITTLEGQVATLNTRMAGHTHQSGTVQNAGGTAILP